MLGDEHLYEEILKSELLQSRLALIEGNFESVISSLENAERLASEKNLIGYLEKIRNEKYKLNDDMEKWDELSHNTKSNKRKLELAIMGD